MQYRELPGAILMHCILGGIFSEEYICYSASSPEGGYRNDVEDGGKIVMPPSALATLSNLDITFPMLFKLSSLTSTPNRFTHCGVLDFIADEGLVYLPKWMMVNNLQLDEGDPVRILLVTLPIATFARFQPLSEDFLDISNPKAVLENHLRRHACLTKDDIIAIHYNRKVYELHVLEALPGTAVNIIECDMTVEFAPPVGYSETAPEPQSIAPQEVHHESTNFVPFQTLGHRLDGRQSKWSQQNVPAVKASNEDRTLIPNYNYKIGSLRFVRVRHYDSSDAEETTFEPFSGPGYSLKHSHSSEKQAEGKS